MGSTKPINSNSKKPPTPKKKAAPAWTPVYDKDMSLAQYTLYGIKRATMGDTVRKTDSLFTYGHNYKLPETDCGHYIQTIENKLGDNYFPNYVPDQVSFMQKYGSWSTNPHDARVGDFIAFSANDAAKSNDKDLSAKYAHIGIVTAVDTLKGIITLMNATSNQDKKTKEYLPGTLKPGHLSMKTGQRTDPGWQTHNGTFAGVGRMYPFIKAVQDSTGSPQSFNAEGNNNSGQPIAHKVSVASSFCKAPAMPPPFTKQWEGAADPQRYWKMPQPDKYNGPYSMPAIQDMPHRPGAKKSGKGGGGVINNVTVQTNDTHHSQPAAGNKDMYNELVAILASAVSDCKIGTDVH